MFSNLPDLQTIVMRIPGVMMAFTFHEFAHAWVATRFGDDTPRHHGRVTLNPRSHLDPIGLILLFIGGFGWARPVLVDPSKLRPRIVGDIAVSLAGVTMNFVLAVLFYVLWVLAKSGMLFGYRNPVLDQTLYEVVWINGIMVGFNLIPVPPLDGFHVARYLFPRNMDGVVAALYRFGPLLLLLLIATPLARTILVPILNVVFAGVDGLGVILVRGIMSLVRGISP